MKFNKEDCLMWAMKHSQPGTPVDLLLKDAEAIREWMSDEDQLRPQWSQVSEFTDAVAERDRARDLAVSLEQENAELEKRLEQATLDSARFQKALLEAMQELEDTRKHLVRGIMIDLNRKANEATLVVQQSVLHKAAREISDRYGVSL